MFSEHIIRKEILEFLEYRFRNNIVGNHVLFNNLHQAFRLMIQNGMLYYTEKSYYCVIQNESNVFINMLEIMHYFDGEHLLLDASVLMYLDNCWRHKLNLRGIFLRNIFLNGVNLTDADLTGADLTEVEFKNANLSNAKLNEIILKDARICEADFRKTELKKANLENADLMGTKFNYADLTRANLFGADLDGADLSNAKLINVNLEKANLRKANLRNADLTGTSLTHTLLVEAILIGAKLDIQKIINKEESEGQLNIQFAVFDETQIRDLEKGYNLKGTRVYTKEGRVLMYEEYCKKDITVY